MLPIDSARVESWARKVISLDRGKQKRGRLIFGLKYGTEGQATQGIDSRSGGDDGHSDYARHLRSEVQYLHLVALTSISEKQRGHTLVGTGGVGGWRFS